MNWLIRTLLHSKTRRPIDPKTHKALDFLVTSYFLLLAGSFWGSHRRAAATALVNAGTVLGLTMLTDYDGGGRRPVSFETHGKVDLIQAGMATGMPVLLGFGGNWRANPFHMQALNEIGVVAATDWEANDLKIARRNEEIAA